MFKRIALFVFGVAVLFFSGTSLFNHVVRADSSLEEELRKTATEYWNYRASGNFEKAYAFEEPSSLGGRDLTTYIRSFGGGVQWLGAKISDIDIKDEKGAVLTAIRYKWTFAQNNPPDGFESTTWDHWILKDGKWYHVFDRPSPAKVIGKPEDAATSEKKEKGTETKP